MCLYTFMGSQKKSLKLLVFSLSLYIRDRNELVMRFRIFFPLVCHFGEFSATVIQVKGLTSHQTRSNPQFST